ncbi:MAG: hypothetical protein ABGZ17_00870, partial [Planctomycetaceae bacterium]
TGATRPDHMLRSESSAWSGVPMGPESGWHGGRNGVLRGAVGSTQPDSQRDVGAGLACCVPGDLQVFQQ